MNLNDAVTEHILELLNAYYRYVQDENERRLENEETVPDAGTTQSFLEYSFEGFHDWLENVEGSLW